MGTAILVGCLATIAGNVYLHYVPSPSARSSLTGTLIGSANGTATIYDLDRKRLAQIGFPNVMTVNADVPAANSLMAVQNPYWVNSQGLFWVNATATTSTGKILEGDVATMNGRGLSTQTMYTSSDEDIDYATPSPNSLYVAYQAYREGESEHLSLVKGRSGNTAHRIANTGGRPSWNSSSTDLLFVCELGQNRLCIYNLPSGHTRQLTVAGYQGTLYPTYSPNGKRILLAASTEPGITGALVVLDAATGQALAVNRSAGHVEAVAWSPSGEQVAYAGPNGVYVCLKLSDDCHLAIRGFFEQVQWVRGTLQNFGMP